MCCNFIIVTALTYYLSIRLSSQHGRLMEPPARNTLWRFGYNTPRNYEDSELFCGGLKVQWQTNAGKCGLCGDAFNRIRNHETGGKMARNITTRNYSPGSTIDAVIDLVANHAGVFQFHMCWRNTFDEIETEQCFEPLSVGDNSKEFYELKTLRRGIFIIPVNLPLNRTCSHCVLRWHWKSANNWGVCENGTETVGCGPQETYRNCADITVDHENGIRGDSNGNRIEDYKFKTRNKYYEVIIRS